MMYDMNENIIQFIIKQINNFSSENLSYTKE